jgi:NADH:ubiquinone reductase (non-electrogenic)
LSGIATRPVVADLMAQIGQADRKVLATDAWLHVHNCEGVYALGDCASVEQRKIAEDITNLFELADKEKSGLLTAEEFLETAEQIRPEYPQIDIYLEHQHMESVIGLLDNAVKDGKQSTVQLDLEHFRKAMCKVSINVQHFVVFVAVLASLRTNKLGSLFSLTGCLWLIFSSFSSQKWHT